MGQSDSLGLLGVVKPLPNMYVIRGAEHRFLGDKHPYRPGSEELFSGRDGLNLLASSSVNSNSEEEKAPLIVGKATLWCLFPGEGGGDELLFSVVHLVSVPRGNCFTAGAAGHITDQSLLFERSCKEDDTSISLSVSASLLRMSERTEFAEITVSMSIMSSSLTAAEREQCAIATGLGSLGLLFHGRTRLGSSSCTAVSSTSALDCMLANSRDEQRVVETEFKKEVCALSATSCALLIAFDINRAFLRGSSRPLDT